MTRLAGDERTYAVRLCRRVKLRDGDPCPLCAKPLGPETPRKTAQHRFTVATDHGEDWVSISTAAKILDKSGALSGWAFNLSVEGALKLRETVDFQGWSQEQLKAALKDIGFTPWVKKEAATKRGSDVHDILERLANGESLEEVEAWIKTNITDPEVAGYMAGVCAWWDESQPIEPLLVEAPVWSAKHRTAGQLDLYARRGKVGIILSDLKTSKAVFEDHVVQLDGYDICVREMIEEGILRLPKPDVHSIILVRPNGTWEEQFVLSNPSAFINALNLTRAVQTIQAHLKEEK